MPIRIRCLAFYVLIAVPALAQTTSPGQKPPISLDEFFTYTDINAAHLSPDGKSAVIETERADFAHDRFRSDLWLWRESVPESADALTLLTSTGHDSGAEWSPDGRYIAFLSDRELPDSAPDAPSGSDNDKKETSRVWIIPADGGEALPLYTESFDTHSFAWTPDSSAIYLSTADPLGKDQEEKLKTDWKDTIRWREQERGDLLLRLPITAAFNNQQPLDPKLAKERAADPAPLPKIARILTRSPLAIGDITPAPDGRTIAFLTGPVSRRIEHAADYEIFLADATATSETPPRQLTHNEGFESHLHWSPDAKTLYFAVSAANGSVDGKYQDVQGRIYSIDPTTGTTTHLASTFPTDKTGNLSDYSITAEGKLLALANIELQTQPYAIDGHTAEPLSALPGTYTTISTAAHSPRILLIRSALDSPAQVYLASDAAQIASARPITHFDPIFATRALPLWKPYRWKSPDGTSVEGVLIYPLDKDGHPVRLDTKHLRMLTLIHGGPADYDGDKFGADWYDWGILAASRGWLVFRPNYRGSTGYGDKFMLDISPQLVSLPGKDILAGVDSLVGDGIADPGHLTIGGYSYGGYMTNWIITQTTRFKAAVSGAGSVEHTADWGNDDMTFDDAWFLGGTPWQQPQRYMDEAAIFRFDKVTTPVHNVIGAEDIRVASAEGYLMERALDNLKIPHSLLVFPGEGHPLAKNPWHGYIKVRQELEWLDRYCPPQ